MRFTLYLTAAAFLAVTGSRAGEFTEKNVRFVDYPGFPEAHSTWGSIGYSSTHNKVYIGVTNHRDRQGLFEYDVLSKTMRLCGFIGDLGHLRGFEWQGKIHTQIVEGPDGAMYFGSDGGETREEDLKEHPAGYGGGFFFKWDPRERRLTNLGMALPYEGIKDLSVDPIDGLLFAVSYPQVHLLAYDAGKNDVRDLGRFGGGHVPRVIFHDWWGNLYYVDWRQRLVEYTHGTRKLVFARDSLPAFPGTRATALLPALRPMR